MVKHINIFPHILSKVDFDILVDKNLAKKEERVARSIESFQDLLRMRTFELAVHHAIADTCRSRLPTLLALRRSDGFTLKKRRLWTRRSACSYTMSCGRNLSASSALLFGLLAAGLLFRPSEAFLPAEPALAWRLSTVTTTTVLYDSFRPQSRQRDKVAIDPKTGLYRPIRSDANSGAKSGEGALSSWEEVKDAFYKGIDRLTGLPKVVPTKKKDYKEDTGVYGGYGEVEKRFASLDGPATLQRRTPTDAMPIKQVMAAAKDKKAITEEPLIAPTRLESVKKAFWGSFDAIPKKDAKRQASTTMSTTMEAFQPTVRARLVASDEFLDALDNLDSPNPVIRLGAGRKIKALARKEEARQEGPSSFAKAKESFYKAADVLQAATKTIADLPRRVAKTYDATLETTEEVVKVAQAMPDLIQQTADELQQSINKGIENSQKTVKSVKELPSRIETGAKETEADIKGKVKKTKDTVEGIKRTAEDVTHSCKVLLGLEMPKPRPPDSPPPIILTPSNVALKILSVAGSLAGEVAWFVGKESTKLAWKATSVAATKGGEVLSEKVKEYQEQQKVAAKSVTKQIPAVKASTASLESPTVDKKKEVSEKSNTEEKRQETAMKDMVTDFASKTPILEKEMTELELEIEEALRMADEAIKSAEDEIKRQKGDTDKKGD